MLGRDRLHHVRYPSSRKTGPGKGRYVVKLLSELSQKSGMFTTCCDVYSRLRSHELLVRNRPVSRFCTNQFIVSNDRSRAETGHSRASS